MPSVGHSGRRRQGAASGRPLGRAGITIKPATPRTIRGTGRQTAVDRQVGNPNRTFGRIRTFAAGPSFVSSQSRVCLGERVAMFARCLLTLAAVLLPFAAEAQSFNCRYARTADEVLICQDPHLSALDERMAGLFFRLRNSLYGYERERLDQVQASWLRYRMSCGGDPACIEDVYRRRISQLRRY